MRDGTKSMMNIYVVIATDLLKKDFIHLEKISQAILKTEIDTITSFLVKYHM